MAADASYFVFQFLSAAGLILLSAWLFFLDPSRSLNRVFAFFLLLRGVRTVAAAFALMTAPPMGTAYWGSMRSYLDLAAVVTLGYFALVYWAPRSVWTRAGKVLLVAAGVAILTFYALDHCTESCETANGRQIGPLTPFRALAPIMMALLGILFALDWAAGTSARARYALYLSAGFALTPLLDMAAFLTAAVHLGFAEIVRINGPGAWGLMPVLMAPVSFLGSLTAVAIWLRHARADPRERGRVHRLAGLALAVIVSGAVAHYAADLPVVGGFDVGAFVFFFIFGVWRLTLPLFVVYALVFYRLFDLDWRVRIGIQKGTMVTLALGAFFITAQILEELLQDYFEGLGEQSLKYLGAATIGVGVYLLHPLQRMAERVAKKGVPHAKSIDVMSDDERLKLYSEHAAIAWEDGVLSRKERVLLDHLRGRLRLTADQAQSVEHRIVRGAARRATAA